MPRYNHSKIRLMESIVAAADEGKTFELSTPADAVNMRQRIYNYRNSVNAGRIDSTLRMEVNRLKVTIVDNFILITKTKPDYMDKVEEQLEKES